MLLLQAIVKGKTYDIPPDVVINLGDFVFEDTFDFWIKNLGPDDENIREIEINSSPTDMIYLDERASRIHRLKPFSKKRIRTFCRGDGPLTFILEIETEKGDIDYTYEFILNVVRY